jgi:hypothetical protein
MLRKCSNCGLRTVDDHLKHCARCGTTFPGLSDERQIPSENGSLGKETATKGIHVYRVFYGFAIVAFIILTFMISFDYYQVSPPKNSPATDRDGLRTAVPTPLPTPTAKILPKFSRGDILTYEPVTAQTTFLWIVLDYDQASGDYHTSHIYRNDDGSWGHWTIFSGDYYLPVQKSEEGMWIYGHLDPHLVTCGELNHDPNSVMFCQDH